MHHIYFRGINRERIVQDDVDRAYLLDLWDEYACKEGINTLVWALLDTHGHVFVRSPVASVSRQVQQVLSRYAVWYNARHGRRGNLFEDRFGSKPVFDSTHARHVARYVLLNPIKAGLCSLASLEDWPWTNLPDLLQGRTRFRSMDRQIVQNLFTTASSDFREGIRTWLRAKRVGEDKCDLFYSTCVEHAVTSGDLRGGSRHPSAVAARRCLARALHDRYGVGSAELARELGVSKSTAFRLLREARTLNRSPAPIDTVNRSPAPIDTVNRSPAPIDTQPR